MNSGFLVTVVNITEDEALVGRVVYPGRHITDVLVEESFQLLSIDRVSERPLYPEVVDFHLLDAVGVLVLVLQLGITNTADEAGLVFLDDELMAQRPVLLTLFAGWVSGVEDILMYGVPDEVGSYYRLLLEVCHEDVSLT